MGRRVLPGGQSVFETRVRPSVFNQLPPEEMIDRTGEAVIWLRQIPTPYTRRGRLAMPDAPEHNGKSYVTTYQKSIRIPQEVAQFQQKGLNRYCTSFTPVVKVHSIFAQRNPALGGDLHMEVDSFEGNSILVKPNDEVKRFMKVFIDYECGTTEKFENCEIKVEENAPCLDLSVLDGIITDQFGTIINVCVEIHELCRKNKQTGVWEVIPPEDYTKTFTTVCLKGSSVFEGDCFKITLSVYHTVNVVYRTMTIHRDETDNQKPVYFKEGDLEMVTSPHLKFSKGDIIIMTNSEVTVKETQDIKPSGLFRLGETPIKEIDQVFGIDRRKGQVEIDSADVTIVDYQHIRIPTGHNKIAVVYRHHPQYRLKDRIEGSALQDRLQPVKWHLVPDTTAIVLN